METKSVSTDNIAIAHRGAWKKNKLPENSIASLRQAITLGCYGSEFDVRMTADGVLIVYHDSAYHHMDIETSKYADLAVHKLSNGEMLPTLREYIKSGLTNNTTTKLICEIKPSALGSDRENIVADKVLAMVKECKAEKNIEYISFSYHVLKRIVQVNPSAITQYLSAKKSPDELVQDRIKGADYHYSFYKNNPDWLERAKNNNIYLNVWTVNDTLDMDWFLAIDFDAVTTDEPEKFIDISKKSPTAQGWKLVWNDEFFIKGLPDTTKWSFESGGHGWGNNELQYYTDLDTNNAIVGNGHLNIIARKELKENKKYTSARLITKDKAEFKYGKIEVRAKLPEGKGTWPAIWMLGKNRKEAGWPLCGEIDIMEHVGFDSDSIHGTIHTATYNHMKKTQKGKAIYISNPYNSFHLYSLEWTPEKIDFMVDGIVYNHVKNEHLSENEWPFDQPFYLIMNLAIGGNWGGRKGIDDSIFPVTMVIDYVRVYQ
ncbi:MAG: family 16 glycosylhydrolase [Saprospiraceae bacterium]